MSRPVGCWRFMRSSSPRGIWGRIEAATGMGRLRFELRTNRLKAEGMEGKTLAMKGAVWPSPKQSPKHAEIAATIISCRRDARQEVLHRQGCRSPPPPTELPSARPARIVSPWLTASSMRLRGWAQKTPVGSKAPTTGRGLWAVWRGCGVA